MYGFILIIRARKWAQREVVCVVTEEECVRPKRECARIYIRGRVCLRVAVHVHLHVALACCSCVCTLTQLLRATLRRLDSKRRSVMDVTGGKRVVLGESYLLRA